MLRDEGGSKIGSALWVGLAALTGYAVFVLPFSFPPLRPARSDAYAAGASNRVAEISVGLLSLLAIAALMRFGRQRAKVEAGPRMGGWWLVGGVIVGAGASLGVGMLALTHGVAFGESAYFLDRVQMGQTLHRAIYSGFQFAYGPLLYWWPAMWMRVGLEPLEGYVTALVLLQAGGFALLYVVMNALPLPGLVRRIGLCCVVLGALSPALGLNYSIFRVVAPLAMMVGLTRLKSLPWACGAALAGVAGCFGVSAEIGVSALLGIVFYAAYRVWQSGWDWVLVAWAGVAGAGFFALAMGSGYFLELRDAGRGGFDLLLTPEPRTILLLVAAVGLAPLAVTRGVRGPCGGVLVAVYGASLGMLPVALGRCDAVHEYFFGLGMMLLSLVAVGGCGGELAPGDEAPALDRQSMRAKAGTFPGDNGWAWVWLGLVLLDAMAMQRANGELFLGQMEALDRPVEAVHVGAIERALGRKRVALGDTFPWRAREQMLRDGVLAPTFYYAMSAVWDEPAEERKIADLRGNDYVLAPVGGFADPVGFEEGIAGRWARLGLHYRQRQEPFTPGELVDQELETNWVAAGRFGQYVLLRRVR